MSQSEAQQLFQSFQSRIDEMTAEAWKQYGSAMQCKLGCTQCCRGDFRISLIEAQQVREAVNQLPYEQQISIKQQLASFSEERCPLLNSEGGCSTYAARPILCRIFGFPVRIPASDTIPERIATCELNFIENQSELFSAKCFDKAAISDVLKQLSHLLLSEAGQSDETVPTFSIFEILTSLYPTEATVLAADTP